MKINKLNRRITLQHKVAGKDEEGLPTEGDWKDLFTVWAAREPLRGREFFQAAAVNSESTVRFKIRYRTGITTKMRVVEGAKEFDIYAVLDDVWGDRTETHLMCREVTAGG